MTFIIPFSTAETKQTGTLSKKSWGFFFPWLPSVSQRLSFAFCYEWVDFSQTVNSQSFLMSHLPWKLPVQMLSTISSGSSSQYQYANAEITNPLCNARTPVKTIQKTSIPCILHLRYLSCWIGVSPLQERTILLIDLLINCWDNPFLARELYLTSLQQILCCSLVGKATSGCFCHFTRSILLQRWFI